MRVKVGFALLFALLVSLLGLWAAFLTASSSTGYVGPAVVASSKGGITYLSCHAPGWMELNISTNGRGELFMVDQFSNKTVFRTPVRGHFNGILLVPHEGSYAIYTSNSSMTLSGHYRGVYPTSSVQNVLYLTIALLSMVLALWRLRS
ncbi:hypothetical protein [Thermococcus sp.]